MHVAAGRDSGCERRDGAEAEGEPGVVRTWQPPPHISWSSRTGLDPYAEGVPQPTASVPLGVAVSLVAVGGAAGAVLRWAVGSAFPSGSAGFPWATFAINVTGSLLLALLPVPLTAVRDRSSRLGPLLGPGLLGGFTTLSATSEEARVLVSAGHEWLASAYLLGTLAAALAVVNAARWWTERRPAGRR